MASQDNNFEDILKKIEDAKGTVSTENYTDVDSLIFAQIAGIDIETLYGPGANVFDETCRDGDAGQGNSINRTYSVQDLIDAYNAIASKRELTAEEQQKLDLLVAMSKSERYKNITYSGFANCDDQEYTDAEGNTYNANFKAVTVNVSDAKIVAYAGTGTSIFGWLEDGRMATSEEGIGAQVWGRMYAEYMMNHFEDSDFMFAGYSKGGNQAIYSAVILWVEYGDRIKMVINIDGPGFCEEALAYDLDGRTFQEVMQELYDNGVLKATSTPECSFVGQLMTNHEAYKYLIADNWLMFLNHDFVNWNITYDADGNPIFVTSNEGQSQASLALEKLITGLLEGVSEENLDLFIEKLEDFCAFAKAQNELRGQSMELTVGGIAEYFSQDPSIIIADLAIFFEKGWSKEDSVMFQQVLDALLKEDNLENFLTAWKIELQNSSNPDAQKLAETLEQIEPFYPYITKVLEGMDAEKIMTLLPYALNFIQKNGGIEGLQEMDAMDIATELVKEFMAMPLNAKWALIKTFKDLVTDAYGAAFEEHPIITAIATIVVIAIAKNPYVQAIAKVVIGILAGIIAIRILWDEIKETLREMKEAFDEFIEKAKDAFVAAIEKISNMIEAAIQKIINGVKTVKAEVKRVVTQKVEEFKTCVKKEIQKFRIGFAAFLYHVKKIAEKIINVSVTLDTRKMADLASRMSAVARKARTLEQELNSLYWQLLKEDVLDGNDNLISLAVKYSISRWMLTPNKSGTLSSASGRLSSAVNELSSLDRRLLE